MGLLGNGFRHNQTGKLFGGTNLDGANPSVHEYRGHMTARMRNQFAGEAITDPMASVPSGARPPVAWVMARRNGAISSRNAAVVSLGASGAGSMGVAASGSTTITFDLAGTGGLISSASGTAGFTLDAAGNVFATKSTSGTAGFALDASGALFASGSLGGSAGMTFGASWTPYAVGWLSGSTADNTVLTVDAIAAGVLAAALTTPIYSDVRRVNAVPVTGDGQPGTEWGP